MRMATAAQSSKDRVYLFRLQMLIIDGGLLVLRNVLDQKLQVQNITLSACLIQERPTITRLKGQKLITQVQYDLLYPTAGQPPPTTADFDITLIICLLRNLKTFGLNRKFNWNTIPIATDTSVEADIYRLKMYRNEISHISTTTGIKLADFRIKWTEIEQILLRINASVILPIPSLQQIIDNFKKNPLDEKAEERIKNEVEAWKELEKGVEADLRLFKQETQSIREDLKQQQKWARKQEERLDEVEKHTSKSTENQNKITDLESKIAKTKETLVKQTETGKLVKEQMHRMEEKVDDIDKYTREITENFDDIDKRTTENTENLADIDQRTSENSENLDKIGTRIRQHSELIKGTQNKIADLEEQISKTNESIENQTEQSILQSAEKKYENTKKQLKDDLIIFYQDTHSKMSLSPLIDEQNTPLLYFYVLPHMNEIQKTHGIEENKIPLESLSGMFKSDGKFSREIYITADAGFGKTSMSKYLAATWCQAHYQDLKYAVYFKQDVLDIMGEYEFLFLVLLRESSDDCSIDDMILNQIVRQLSSSYNMTKESLQEVLHKERCLVVLDGLDEWTHPEQKCTKVPKSIPHRNARERTTIVTTTRPWKLSVIEFSTCKLEKKIELSDLSSESADTLKERAILKIKHITPENAINETEIFNEKIEDNNLEDLESVPLMLLYLVCLHCDDIPLGQSKYGLYTNIVELLLKRTLQKYPEMKGKHEPSKTESPQFFDKNKRCAKYFQLLKKLGHLAFSTLFGKTRENTLVFDRSVAKEYLTKDELNLCLLSGLLTQSKVQNVTSKSYKMSFSHKSMQEYFCALYCSCANERSVHKVVLQHCSNVQDILDLSTLFMFISGMNGETMSLLSQGLMSVISKDRSTQEHRLATGRGYFIPLKGIQDMYISCCKEMPDDKALQLWCKDFILDVNLTLSYFESLKLLAKRNKNCMESVSIDTRCVPCSLREVIDFCGLDDLMNIRKILYSCCKGKYEDEEIARILNAKSLQSVTVNGGRSVCSRKLYKAVQNLPRIQVIDISGLEMEHGHLEKLVECLNRKSMTQIRLWGLDCITHGQYCKGVHVNWWKCSHLRDCTISGVPVRKVEVNVSSLEKCTAGRLYNNPIAVTSFLRCLPAARKLHTLGCEFLKSPEQIEVLVGLLPRLAHVKQVSMWFVNLGESLLTQLPVNIEVVNFTSITISASCAREIVKTVENISHKVKVEMFRCVVRPETEFDDVRKYVRTSDNFQIIADNGPSLICGHYEYDFVFETLAIFVK